MNQIWNFISNLGLAKLSDPAEHRSLKIYNRLLFMTQLVIVALMILDAVFFNNTEVISVILIKLIYTFLLMLLAHLGYYKVSRLIFLLAFIPAFLIQSALLHPHLGYPFLQYNVLCCIVIQLTQLFFLFEPHNHKTAQNILWVFVVLFFLDIPILHYLMGIGISSYESYVVFKPAFFLLLLLQFFASRLMIDFANGVNQIDKEAKHRYDKLQKELDEVIHRLDNKG